MFRGYIICIYSIHVCKFDISYLIYLIYHFVNIVHLLLFSSLLQACQRPGLVKSCVGYWGRLLLINLMNSATFQLWQNQLLLLHCWKIMRNCRSTSRKSMKRSMILRQVLSNNNIVNSKQEWIGVTMTKPPASCSWLQSDNSEKNGHQHEIIWTKCPRNIFRKF